MSSLVKDSGGPGGRPRSPFWYCCYTRADGTRTKVSTKETDRLKAKAICDAWADAEQEARKGPAAEQQIRHIMNGILTRTTGKPTYDPTVRQWLDRWVASEKSAIAKATFQRYQQVVKDFLACIGPVVADRRLEAVTSDDVIKYRDQLEAGGRAPRTINLVIKRVLKRAFKVAIEEGLISRNPCATVRLTPDRGRIEKGVFTPKQISALVEHAKGDWKGLIICAYYTGGRLRDLSRLRWSNVDLAEKTITFTQRKLDGKSAKAAVKIPIHPALEEYLLSGASSDSPNAPVFPELYDIPGAGGNGLSIGFKRIMENARINPGLIRERKGKAGRSLSALSFHSLRHSFNSALANAGVPQELRQKLTGHASSEMNTHYTHHELKTIRAAVDTLPDLRQPDQTKGTKSLHRPQVNSSKPNASRKS